MAQLNKDIVRNNSFFCTNVQPSKCLLKYALGPLKLPEIGWRDSDHTPPPKLQISNSSFIYMPKPIVRKLAEADASVDSYYGVNHHMQNEDHIESAVILVLVHYTCHYTRKGQV